MGSMNIHIRKRPKYEHSYNLANLCENWVQNKNRAADRLIKLRPITSSSASPCARLPVVDARLGTNFLSEYSAQCTNGVKISVVYCLLNSVYNFNLLRYTYDICLLYIY